jgi:adenylate cyclase
MQEIEQQKGVLVADLSGYTALTEAHGSRMAADLVKRFEELVAQSLTGTCRLVQRVGDEVLIISDGVDDLLITALRLQALTQSESKFLAVHAGIHYGGLLEEEGNFYGTTLNLASRIASHSGEGQVLCSATAVTNLQNKSLTNFNSLGSLRFKNVKETVEIFAVTRFGNFVENIVDPVCRMVVKPNETNCSYQYAGKTYFFCSPGCLDSFAETPELFVS